jgi:hypothetical protein
MGDFERTATCSISSMVRLKAPLRVLMPDFKKAVLSCFSFAKRAASWSNFDRSKSMMAKEPTVSWFWRRGGEDCSSAAGK